MRGVICLRVSTSARINGRAENEHIIHEPSAASISSTDGGE